MCRCHRCQRSIKKKFDFTAIVDKARSQLEILLKNIRGKNTGIDSSNSGSA
jgi:hypothetical protein